MPNQRQYHKVLWQVLSNLADILGAKHTCLNRILLQGQSKVKICLQFVALQGTRKLERQLTDQSPSQPLHLVIVQI